MCKQNYVGHGFMALEREQINDVGHGFVPLEREKKTMSAMDL